MLRRSYHASMDSLPIDTVIPALLDALARCGQAVLQAPPGAGKTTRVPLALLSAGLVKGRIVMLEPRRLATRAAAERMAETLGEPVGATVGYRMRGESRVTSATRIEVVTEGILTRMIQSDPELPGIGALIFDEFHERSLNADLALALALEVRAALRPDLLLLPMSATLDAAPVAALMGDAPVITAEGRAYPVDTIWLDRPLPRDARLESELTPLIQRAVAETSNGVLVFLPGESEIRRVQSLLTGRLPDTCIIRPLYGAMPFAAQRDALASERPGLRKIVLATAIAETSLTLPDIRAVVDAGRARRSRFDPGSGMSRLVTERVTRAEATQRAGRAGRVAPGRCYRLWTRAEEGALAAFPPPEIAAADLTGLALELALWGDAALPFLTPPPAPALAEAQSLLRRLGALDPTGRITPHGRALAAMPLHPRLAHMLAIAGKPAAPVAALLSERDPLRGAGADLALRLAALRGEPTSAQPDRAALDRIRTEARRLSRNLPDHPPRSPGAMAALAYPDRIGQRRPGGEARFILSGGKGAIIDAADPLANAPWIVATDLDGDTRESRVRIAAAITESDIRDLFAPDIRTEHICRWSRREGRVTSRLQERLGALTLSDRAWTDAGEDALTRAMCDGVRDLGLSWTPAALRFRARVELARAGGEAMPDMTGDALLAGLETWLLPFLKGVRTAADWKRFDMLEALRSMLDWSQTQRLDTAVPSHVETPLGRRVPVDYDSGDPAIEVRLQELFGVTRHPTAAGKPLKVTLLSPAGAPLQVTTDLPRFWATSYADVRRDMRGRYPRHPWPDDPTVAEPTTRAKPRGT
jgi:ATP-dependent helicase HrpB